MEDNIPLKKRKSKYERVESKEKVLVWVREIKSFDAEGQATLSSSQGPFMLELHLPLSLLFKLWETQQNYRVPFSSWFYAAYPFNHPTPFPKPDESQNEPRQLSGNDTPYSINLRDGTIIFAKTLIILPRPAIRHHPHTSTSENRSNASTSRSGRNTRTNSSFATSFPSRRTYRIDGHMPDGDTPDGHTPDGHTPDGNTPDGHMPDGHRSDGHRLDGHRPDGYVSDGHRPDGYGADGHMSDGHRSDGHIYDGHRPDGHRSDGHMHDGYLHDGYMPDGHR